jgi:hypothetical protein
MTMRMKSRSLILLEKTEFIEKDEKDMDNDLMILISGEII